MSDLKKVMLTFDPMISSKKPNDVVGESSCPFCSYTDMENLIKEDGSRLWVNNKYPTIKEVNQTVIIESDAHDFRMYEAESCELNQLFKFIMSCWRQFDEWPSNLQTVFLKNQGIHSGSSLNHPHLQLLGFKEDVGSLYMPSDFEGIVVKETDQLFITVSTQPICGYIELNLRVHQDAAINSWTNDLMGLVRFAVGYRDPSHPSYNIFGWKIDEYYQFKVVPRFVTSAYYIGFRLSQVFSTDQLIQIAEDLKLNYLSS
ncbi:DUF4931 domain-containing protein [Atopobacter phocae]|uniref:DUF4931 domain-containing protein n=1 Tax=Atopobacter phocae TaxID=136492 RepID=UPI00047177EC|nr:DUF4931 domain-containing protein [Atopobacter phocae]